MHDKIRIQRIKKSLNYIDSKMKVTLAINSSLASLVLTKAGYHTLRIIGNTASGEGKKTDIYKTFSIQMFFFPFLTPFVHSFFLIYSFKYILS